MSTEHAYKPGDIVAMREHNHGLMSGLRVIHHYNSIGQPYLLGRTAAYGWDEWIDRKVGHTDDPYAVATVPLSEADIQAVYATVLSGIVNVQAIIDEAMKEGK